MNRALVTAVASACRVFAAGAQLGVVGRVRGGSVGILDTLIFRD